MIRPLTVMVAVVLLAASAAAGVPDPFADPVKDCRPCRFSPGPGQPEFDLTFVFEGSGDNRALTAFEIAPAGGGKTQRFDTGHVAVADFAAGFTLSDSDLNFDGLGDLALVTGEYAAGNESAEYWIYRPERHDFVPLERVGAGEADQDDRALVPMADELYCHVHDSAVAYSDYWYRISGHRAVAVREEDQGIVGDLVVHTTSDLTVKPPRVRRVTIGYNGDTPARAEFLKRLDDASQKAAALYDKGDAEKAAATMAIQIGTVELAFIVDSYPVQGDDPADRKLVGQFNDYGFYLAQAGRLKDAIGVLGAVIDVDADRTVAYLNLADAEYAAGDKADARTNYEEYRKRMAAAHEAARIPRRVVERLR